MSPADCPLCRRVGERGDFWIADLLGSRAYLNEDQFYPGWVYLVLRRHATELWELTAEERAVMVEDVNQAARALGQVYRPLKMNYELLGNQVPHIHWHLVPRLTDDPDPRWPVWRTPHEPRPLPPAERDGRIAEIRRALAGAGVGAP
jgi:diadenosine tetraphosphate (Ap4A) HIT family hydrolase